ncbi:hypothetical protein JD844_032238, partial [Phrynosoma platyrhinos]
MKKHFVLQDCKELHGSKYKAIEQRVWRPLTVLYPKDNEVIEVQIGSSQNLSCKALVGEGADIMATSRWEYSGEKDPERFDNFSC